MSQKNLVSVVVTTKNEGKNIGNCLKSIKLQTYPSENIEVIVVDNNSTDNTINIAKEYTDQVFTQGPERSRQRNFGLIEKSTGDMLLYLDADMVLSPTLIEECVNFINETNAVALYISEIVLGKNFFSKVRRFEREFYDGKVIDAARFFKKETLVKSKGFDESLTGPEDWDLDKRIKLLGKVLLLPKNPRISIDSRWELQDFVEKRGVKIKKAQNVLYHNESEFKLRPYVRKKSYYSKTFSTYLNKWGPKDPDIQKQLSFLYRFIIVFVEGGGWKKIFLHPVLTIGMLFLRTTVGIAYILSKLI